MERVVFLAMNSLAWLAGSQSSTPTQHSMATAISPQIPEIIPGESNLKFCNESRDTDLFQIERLSVWPTPPLVEEDLLIYIYGTFLEDISENATFDWYVHYTYNPTVGDNGTLAFCDIMETIEQPDPNREKQCPPEKGWAMISIRTWIPWLVGEGNFTVKFDAKTKEGNRIYCVDGNFDVRYPEKKHELKA